MVTDGLTHWPGEVAYTAAGQGRSEQGCYLVWMIGYEKHKTVLRRGGIGEILQARGEVVSQWPFLGGPRGRVIRCFVPVSTAARASAARHERFHSVGCRAEEVVRRLVRPIRLRYRAACLAGSVREGYHCIQRSSRARHFLLLPRRPVGGPEGLAAEVTVLQLDGRPVVPEPGLVGQFAQVLNIHLVAAQCAQFYQSLDQLGVPAAVVRALGDRTAARLQVHELFVPVRLTVMPQIRPPLPGGVVG